MATTQIKDGYNGGSDNQLKVNNDGSINVNGGGGGGGNNSVGPTGSPDLGYATEIGGIEPSGALEPLQLDSSGNLKVVVEGGGGSPNVNLIEVGGSAISLGIGTTANSLPVVLPASQIST